MLRNSERADYKRCILRWHWRYVEHLVPIEFRTGPLVFGTLGHLALADWYIPGTKRGAEPAETWDQITKDLWDTVKTEKYVDDEIEGDWEDARALGHSMLIEYRKEYGLDDQWEVLWVEDQFHQNIPNPLIKGKAIVEYVGTIDLVVRDLATGKIWYVDHKFMKQIETEHLYIDDQNSGYLAIGTHELRKRGVISEREAVKGLIYNFLRKAKPDIRPQNKFGEKLNKDGSVSLKQPATRFLRHPIARTNAERNQQIREIGNDALHMKAVRAGRLPIIKRGTKDCKWDCSFFDMCQTRETGGDIELVKKALFKKDDPYSEYQKGAESPKILSKIER